MRQAKNEKISNMAPFALQTTRNILNRVHHVHTKVRQRQTLVWALKRLINSSHIEAITSNCSLNAS